MKILVEPLGWRELLRFRPDGIWPLQVSIDYSTVFHSGTWIAVDYQFPSCNSTIMTKILFVGVLTFVLIGITVHVQALSTVDTSVSFTELSSTDLVATTGTVTPISPDQWLWTRPADPPGLQFVGAVIARVFWLEPESPPILSGVVTLNELAPGPNGATDGSVTIISDFQGSISIGTPTINSDGATVPNAISYLYDDTSGVPALFTFYSVSFTDDAALSEVPAAAPEPASLLLLGSGVAGLGGVSLWRRRRQK